MACNVRETPRPTQLVCIAHAEDTIALRRTGVGHVLGPACNGGGGGYGAHGLQALRPTTGTVQNALHFTQSVCVSG